jgi:hypothetical protein
MAAMCLRGVEFCGVPETLPGHIETAVCLGAKAQLVEHAGPVTRRCRRVGVAACQLALARHQLASLEQAEAVKVDVLGVGGRRGGPPLQVRVKDIEPVQLGRDLSQPKMVLGDVTRCARRGETADRLFEQRKSNLGVTLLLPHAAKLERGVPALRIALTEVRGYQTCALEVAQSEQSVDQDMTRAMPVLALMAALKDLTGSPERTLEVVVSPALAGPGGEGTAVV